MNERKRTKKSVPALLSLALTAVVLVGAAVGTALMTAEIAVAQSPGTYTQMDATNTTTGMSLYSGRKVHAEYVGGSSALIGKMVDSITVKIRKVGSPTGTAEIGIINSDTTMKKVFGTIDVSTLTGTYTDKTFALDVYAKAYKIVSGDYIGIKYTGGDETTNHVGVMRDTTAPFDSTNTYHKYYTTTWVSQTDKDLYLKLTYTPPKYVMIHFDDGWSSVYNNKSILDEHNINSTQFIICGDVGDTNKMTWTQIHQLDTDGHSIQNHGMEHDHFPTMTEEEIIDDVAGCYDILVNDEAVSTGAAFALPFNDGDELQWVVESIAEALPSTSFGKGDNGYPQEYDCDDPPSSLHDCDIIVSGSYNQNNKYTMTQWSHDYFRRTTNHTDAETFTEFQTVVGTGQVSDQGVLENLPIVTYHKVDSSGVTATQLDLHMEHLRNNTFWTITMDDIQYNATSKKFELKSPG